MSLSKEFSILVTGSLDNDLAAERIAGTGKNVIHHKLPYIQMYQEFSELKKIQIKLRNSEAAFGKKVYVIIDISEWICHENDEYFLTTLKYLHDKRSRMKYIFTVGDSTVNDITPIFLKIRCFLIGGIEIDRTLMEVNALSEYLVEQCFQKEAADVFAEFIMEDEAAAIRTIPTINCICRELQAGSKDGKIRPSELKDYLKNTESLANIVYPDLCSKYANKLESKTIGAITGSNNKKIS